MEVATEEHYHQIVSKCKDIFLKKNKDYGPSWSIMRLSSLTDQIFIKAKRIRNIQESEQNIIGDSQTEEFQGIINYCLMAMMIEKEHIQDDIEINTLSALYDQYASLTFELMKKKNADYGEVWRDMRVSSMTDLILTKLLRIKQIENNKGVTIASEGAFSNYQDILNYSIFSIILLDKS
jgi:hypothetical protein